MPLSVADFLAHYHLLVDVTNSCLIDVSSFKTTLLKNSTMLRDIIATAASSKFQYLQEYPSFLARPLWQMLLYHHDKPPPPPPRCILTFATLPRTG